ncbi:MAG: hypothetical protein ACREE3_12855 [Stellaceae bacterium]
MRTRLPVLLVIVWAGLATLAGAFAAEPVFPPASRIGLVPPGDLTVSTKYNGFEDTARHVAINMLDLPGPAYQALVKSAFAANPAKLTVEKREMFPFNSGVGYLITGYEEENGVALRSWYLLADTSNRAIGHIAALIAVHVPEAARAVYTDKIVRDALRTVTFRTPPASELIKLLPFRLKDMAGFRLLKVAPAGVLILIDGPSDDLSKHPYMIVSLGRGAPQSPDARPRFARDLLMSAPLADLAITSMESMRIEGGPGYEARASATGPDGKPLALVQWMRFGSGNVFLRVIGIVAKDHWDALFPRFRAVRDGIEVR